MNFENTELHNVGAVEEIEGLGDSCLMRVPEKIRHCLNERARFVAMDSIGCEIRFVTDAPHFDIYVSASQPEFDPRGEIRIFKGNFQCRVCEVEPGRIHNFRIISPEAFNTPKKGFFAYRDALEPLKVNLRTDKTRYFSSNEITAEVWICNDTNREDDLELIYSTEDKNGFISLGSITTHINDCTSEYQGLIKFIAPEVKERQTIKINVGLLSGEKTLSTDTISVELFPKVEMDKQITTFSFEDELSEEIIKGFNLDTKQKNSIPDLILIDKHSDFTSNKESILESVRQGATLLFLSLENGEYEIAKQSVEVKGSSMMPIHFVSINEDSDFSKLFYEDDFRFWYNPKDDGIKPIIYSTFVSDGFRPILESGNTNDSAEWCSAIALGVKEYGKGKIYISMLDIRNRVSSNPIVRSLLKIIFGMEI
ncbi:MAG: hypothetical protein OCD02_03950 [Spirochaetaceae bacterium]